MPTPFYHLNLADELLSHPKLPDEVQHLLNEQRAAFLFGKTAPDVQVISGQARKATHFYTLPFRKIVPAWNRMLALYPELAEAKKLAHDHAAFIAGYLCHLQADQFWSAEIFLPTFGPTQGWETFRQRLYLHNVLRAYMDRQILEDLSPDMGSTLEHTQIDCWLPFVGDKHLERWRGYLSEQLRPGAGIRTVEVFANRQGVAKDVFEQLLRSEEDMEREIFSRLSPRQLADFRERLILENTRLLTAYLRNI